MIALVERAPVSPVNEEERSARVVRREEIHRLLGPAAVANVELPAELRPRDFALARPALEPLRMVGEGGAQIVFALDEVGRRLAHAFTPRRAASPAPPQRTQAACCTPPRCE